MFFVFFFRIITIQPDIHAKKLITMNIPHGFIHWILAYLQIGHNLSTLIETVVLMLLSLILVLHFISTLYIADCRTQEINYPLIKFADNTAMTGLFHNNDDTKYLLHMKSFADCFNNNYLQLNIPMTKELVIDFRRTASPPPPLFSSTVLKSKGYPLANI